MLLYMVVSEREFYYDDRSEAWQESDRGDAFVESTNAIREIVETPEGLDRAGAGNLWQLRAQYPPRYRGYNNKNRE